MFAEPKMTPSKNNNAITPIKTLSKNRSLKPARQQPVNDKQTMKNHLGCMQLKTGMSFKDENPESTVIQRKIGFEFQTNCHVSKSVMDNGVKKRVCLEKDELLRHGTYVNAVADEHAANYSDVEFVTIPLNNYGDLKKTDDEMKEMWKFLNERYVNKKKRYNGNTYKIKPGAELRGNPQATFGTSLTSIKSIAKAAKKKRMKAGKNSNEKLSAIKQTRMSDLSGLVELIKSYIRCAEDKTEIKYPKIITDSFLLARTDFGSLLKLCEEPMPPTLKEWLNLFKGDFVINKPLFPHIKEKSGEEWDIPLTIKEWLKSLYNNKKDLIQEVPHSESMSKKGLETVTNYQEEEDELVGLFELRGNQGIKHYLNGNPSWLEFMDYWYKTIEKTGYLPPSAEPAKKSCCLTF